MLQCELSDLGMEALEIRLVRVRLQAAKHVGCSYQQVLFPFHNLVRRHIKLLRELSERLVPLQCCERHVGFEPGCVIPFI